MPVYDYKCEKCEYVQEKSHKIADKNTEACANCGAPAEHLKKQLSPIAPHVSWSKWRI